MYFAIFLLNKQKHIIQHERVKVNFSGEKEHFLGVEPFVLVMKISTTHLKDFKTTLEEMDRQTNNKCLERIKNWRNDFLQATTDVSNPKQSL